MTEIIDELKTDLESSEETQTTQDTKQIEVETEEQYNPYFASLCLILTKA